MNNVTYVDYLQEARIALLSAAGAPPRMLSDGVVVVRHEVHFQAPLVFRAAPVSIDCWVTKVSAATASMAFEVYDEDEAGERTIYLQATTVLAPYSFELERPRRVTEEERAALTQFLDNGFEPAARIPKRFEPNTGHDYELFVRWSDVDAYRHVNNVKYFEYCQESRIAFMTELMSEGPGRRAMVVAQTDVDYFRPIMFRLEPYVVRTRVQHVGKKSFVMVTEIIDQLDDELVLARARVVMVAFDTQTQHSVELDPERRERLLASLTPGS